MLFLSLLLSHSYFALAAFVSVTIHESGHLIAAKILNIDLTECKIDIFGAALSPALCDFSYKDEIFLCICGPAANFFTSVVCVPLYHFTDCDFLLYFILSSFSLAILNLLPVKDFDGGRIFNSLLCLISDTYKAEQITLSVSFVVILLLWIVSVYLLLIARSNLSLFVFSISLFVKIFVKEN